jgi:hypothetical protein
VATVQFLVRVEIFLFTVSCRPALGPTQLTVTGTRDHFSRKYARSMKLKHRMLNAWNCTFTPHISLHGTVLMHKGTFPLYEYSEKWKITAVVEIFWYLDCNWCIILIFCYSDFYLSFFLSPEFEVALC